MCFCDGVQVPSSRVCSIEGAGRSVKSHRSGSLSCMMKGQRKRKRFRSGVIGAVAQHASLRSSHTESRGVSSKWKEGRHHWREDNNQEDDIGNRTGLVVQFFCTTPRIYCIMASNYFQLQDLANMSLSRSTSLKASAFCLQTLRP